MLQHIRGNESGCHSGLVFATNLQLKMEVNEYLSKLVLLTKKYSTCQRLYIDVHVKFMVIIHQTNILMTTDMQCANSGRVKYCAVATNTYGSSVRDFLRVTLLAIGILRYFLEFWKICGPLS
jgi:hypothetical protein